MDTNARKILRFSTDDFPQHERIAAYREIYGSTIVQHEIEPIGDQPFRFESTLCKAPGLGLASSVVSSSRRWRGRQHAENDDLVLGFSFGAACLIGQRDREASAGPGVAVLTRSADPVSIVIPSASPVVTLRIPDCALRTRIADLDAWIARPITQSTEERLLTGYIAAMFASNAFLEADLCALAVAHVHDLICLMLAAKGEPRELALARGLRAVRLAAVLGEIERRSDDHSLSAAGISAELGITARYVHLVLEKTGKSFTQHLLERRLQRSAARLRDPRWRHRRIADVALGAGFNDLSYFNRAFRRRYAATPSELRAAAFAQAN